jgi:hypothetical protein
MICKCGNSTRYVKLQRGNETHGYRECMACGREHTDDKADEMQNRRFSWQRVGWYQETLRPMTFLQTEARMYDICLLRRPTSYVSSIPSAYKYLHGMIEADGNMIFNDNAQTTGDSPVPRV